MQIAPIEQHGGKLWAAAHPLLYHPRRKLQAHGYKGIANRVMALQRCPGSPLSQPQAWLGLGCATEGMSSAKHIIPGVLVSP